MILSVSRRTDIPAFYAKWFINRIREGYCIVPNPFNSKQLSRIDLTPKNVDMIVFWTRNPKPLFPYLKELDQLGYKYYFQFTLMNNPKIIETNKLPFETAIKNFQELANLIGKDKVIWRYDPIILSNITNLEFHLIQYQNIAEMLSKYTFRSVISIIDNYVKTNHKLKIITQEHNVEFFNWDQSQGEFQKLLLEIAKIAKENKLEIFSCSETIDLEKYGIQHGKCIDDEYINQVFGIEVSHKKDHSQREACGCVLSRDIGMYDSCLFGCQYCYATRNFDQAKENYQNHNPLSPSLIGNYNFNEKVTSKQLELF